jgi:hypothetical protein
MTDQPTPINPEYPHGPYAACISHDPNDKPATVASDLGVYLDWIEDIQRETTDDYEVQDSFVGVWLTKADNDALERDGYFDRVLDNGDQITIDLE